MFALSAAMPKIKIRIIISTDCFPGCFGRRLMIKFSMRRFNHYLGIQSGLVKLYIINESRFLFFVLELVALMLNSRVPFSEEPELAFITFITETIARYGFIILLC